MRDPVSGPIDFAFFMLALAVMLWVAVDPKRVFELLFSYTRVIPLSDGVVALLRVLATLCACGLTIVLIIHLVRSR